MTDVAATRVEVGALIVDPAPLGYDTEGDMLAVSDRIDDMTPAENDQVFGAMSDRELTQWADRVYAPGTLGVGEGLSADQRQVMFQRMGGHFSGDLQARVITKFNRQPGEQAAFGAQVARLASPADRLAFVQGAARDVAGPELSLHAGLLGQKASLSPNEMGVAVAKVLASLRDSPQEFNAAVASLAEQGKLDDVVEAAVGMTRIGEDNLLSPVPFGADPSPGTNYDAQLLRGLVDAGVEVGSPQTRQALAQSVESLRLTIVRGETDRHGHSLPKPAQEIGLTDMVARLRGA